MTRSDMGVYQRMAEDNWGAWAQGIGGAVDAGETLPAVRQSLREGIATMLADLADRGLRAPAAAARSIDFSELDPDSSKSRYEIEWLTVDLPEREAHKSDLAKHAA